MFHAIPAGPSAWQIVIARPPVIGTRFNARSLPAQNAIDVPSGEKTGLVTRSLSVPAIGLASSSDMDLRYNRRPLAYTSCVPSGETARDGRPCKGSSSPVEIE